MESKIPPLVCDDQRVSVGRFTYGNPRLRLWDDSERVEIGSFCSFADDVVIFGGGEHRLDWVTTHPLRIAFGSELAGKDGHPASKGATRIGNDVWIGHGAMVLSGVTIGDGAVIGAGAVVARNVPPYCVAVGNPVQVLRARFSPEQIAALLEIRWWDWPCEKIEKYAGLLCSPDIDAFIEQARIDTSLEAPVAN